jgi:hypothetical protein
MEFAQGLDHETSFLLESKLEPKFLKHAFENGFKFLRYTI